MGLTAREIGSGKGVRASGGAILLFLPSTRYTLPSFSGTGVRGWGDGIVECNAMKDEANNHSQREAQTRLTHNCLYH